MIDPHPTPISLRRLIALAKPEARLIVAGTLFLVVGSGMGLLFPQAVRVIIDEAFGEGNRDIVDLAALAMLIIFFIQGIAVALRLYLFSIAGERIVARLRARLYEGIVQQEVAFFDARKTGELTSRLASDTATIQSTVSVNVSLTLRSGASAVGGVAFLFYTSPFLAMFMLLVVPPVVLASVVLGRRIRNLSRRSQDALAQAGEVAEETIAGIRTVRSFTREPQESERYSSAVMEAFRVSKKRIVASALFIGFGSFAGYAAVAVVLWYGGRMVTSGDMSVGDLTSFILYTLIVAFSFGTLGNLWAELMRASGAAQRVFELIDREPRIPLAGGQRIKQVKGHVELEDVDFAYPARPDVEVLKGVSLSVAPGEIVALVGPSGAGKSTIAALIPRFYDPNSGALRFDGEDLRQLDPEWLRQQVGIVAQEPILFSTTVEENIRYGRGAASQQEIEAAARAANAHEFIEAFPDGYKTLVGERGVQLSGGQKQRVAIARALLKDPRVLILDEATSALDAESEAGVKEALDRLMRGRTTLVIAHRLSTVRDAHRVVVLETGEIVQQGTHAELLEGDGLYRRLIERQFMREVESSPGPA